MPYEKECLALGYFIARELFPSLGKPRTMDEVRSGKDLYMQAGRRRLEISGDCRFQLRDGSRQREKRIYESSAPNQD